MKDPWDYYMRVGIVHPMAFPETLHGEGPILETLRRVAEDEFFSAVDVVWVKNPAVRREAGALLRDSGMEVTFAAQSVLLLGKHDLNSAEPKGRRAAVDQVRECVDQAVDLGVSRLSVLSGYDPGPGKREQAVELMVDSLSQICRYAREKAGIPVALKVFDREVEKKSLIGPAEDAYRLAKEVRRGFPDFGLIHDLSHLPLLGEKPAEVLPMLKAYLVQMHMGNSVTRDRSHPLYGDTHPVFGIEGGDSGVEELADYLRVLFDIGFLAEGKRPFVGFEIKPPPGMTSEIVIANAKRTFREAWYRLPEAVAYPLAELLS